MDLVDEPPNMDQSNFNWIKDDRKSLTLVAVTSGVQPESLEILQKIPYRDQVCLKDADVQCSTGCICD